MLRDPADADDAFQATSLVLALRAGEIRGRGSAGSWLHGVALRVAAESRKAAARRQVHERRAAVAVAPVGEAGAAVLAALREANLTAVGRVVSGGVSTAGAASAVALALAIGTARSLSMICAKMTLTLAATLLLAAAGFGACQIRAEPPAAVAPPMPAGPPAPGRPDSARTIRVVVLNPRWEPESGVNVKASIWTEEKDFQSNRDYVTDSGGSARVELPATFFILRLWARKLPYVAMDAHWERAELASDGTVPAQYTFGLEPAAPAGGRVLDERGRPIEGGRVRVSLDGDARPAKGEGHAGYDTWLTGDVDAPKTDAEGRWRIANVPDRPEVALSLLVTHPDYESDEVWQQSQKADGVTTAMLWAGRLP